MRILIALFALLAITTSASAAEQADTNAALIKGSKSYQTRYVTTNSGTKIEEIEPAAGAETTGAEEKVASVESAEDIKPSKKMVLHGKR
ncbi:MAG: hypothetical protein WC043_09965 [Pseudobdellovibrionaceae bacterium]